MGLRTLAMAEVPYKFSAGTPAKAAEVNANFNALDDRLKEIEAGGSNGSCTDFYSGFHKLGAGAYTPNNSQVGDKMTVLGMDYVIVKVPFVEFGTGEAYAVKFPMRLSYDAQSGVGYVDDNGQTMTEHVLGGATPCYDLKLANFPAEISLGERRTFRLNNSNRASGQTSTNYAMYCGIRILINQTALSIYIPTHLAVAEQSVLIAEGDYDFTDDLDTEAMTHKADSLIQAIDELIDYISIERLP